ncbi:sortilin-related receptor-like isoform X2 [Cylas formicarius]|uniref:sortilin-related receptor-like isoform X2 n=1 Tax=Cylas formicarius TaxID=197179 RepID=UPI002958C6A6|nr:sortilin-related receptor-like isoform X2 [Cylas formicarius]
MIKKKMFVLLIWTCYCFGVLESAETYGKKDPPLKKTYLFSADLNNFEHGSETFSRGKRSTSPPPFNDSNIAVKINYLNDTHKQLMVHWVGEHSKVVICLARDPSSGILGLQQASPSAVYISYDDGDTYKNKTDQFQLPNNKGYATLEKFYNHPVYNTHFVFTDILHNLIYVTTNYGKSFKRIELKFTPSQLSYHELQPSTFVVLDKNDTQSKLWITEDFGETFRPAHEFVKSFYWIKDTNDNHQLLIHRYEPNGLSTIIFSKTLFRTRMNQVYATNVHSFFMKNDYLFTSKKDSKLYVSYKLGRQIPCMFDTTLPIGNYLIVDVTGNRALVAASHSEEHSNLYVSENLGGNSGRVKFTLSLENVFAFFPNSTWQDTWLYHIADEAFADVYKVEGLTGIYIASRVVQPKSNGSNNLGPYNLGSVITFNHGASWRLIKPPAVDIEKQSTGCLPSKGCSLHLSQKFSQLYPESRSVSILSSKSAPGIIMATGVLGSNLKGHYGVYISLDAGLTWHQTLRDLYFFNMGDHGGILSAVKYYKAKGETRHILYSIDEGENWNQTAFHNEEIRLYGLMTEPGENTTIFTMFGSLPKEHNWIIVKVDFARIFKSQCGPNDYKMWSPSQTEENRSYIPCILGEQTTYQRRTPKAYCLNGLDFVRLISKQPCDCDILDFECDFGFNKTETMPPRCILDKSLQSYNPYDIPIKCEPGQFYNRTKGYRKISGDVCVQGFEQHYLPDLVPCPMKVIYDFLLFAQRESISTYNLVTKSLEVLPLYNLKNVIAVDYDLKNNCVYWADISSDTVSRQCFTSGGKPEVLVSNDLASIEGMAFDWISENLYFVDGVRAKIELIRTNISYSGRMRRTILNETVLKKPRGIALHPQHGYMFWTDWSAENPSVNRANLDGSNNFTLFGKDKVEWPNGITVDYIANRIYWVDARQDYIGSSDLHGDGFIKIVHDVDVVSHPFAIAVFKNDMYWDDWKKNAIFVSDKDIYKGYGTLLKDVSGIMDLKIFATGLRTGTNACANASCPYICVGLPKNNYTCLCPDGMEMSDAGKCLCPGGVEPFANGTCLAVNKSCSPEHFTCANGLCVPKGWKCDGEDDCGDGSDEARCGTQTCPPTFHVCGDGKCLPHYWKCDYDKDCADGSDELNCPRQNCTDSQFACDNGRCVALNWRCDHENDCRDGSDESNCDADKPVSCKAEDEFQCKSGAVTCIPSTWKCDDEPDCRDSSDEANCTNNVCSELQFSCGPPTNRCIFNTWVCDGDKDCTNGKDEENCTKTEIPKTPSNTFLPKNNTCQDWMFKCQNDRCIPFWWRCDEVDDCGDNSDESDCQNLPASTTQPPTPQSTPKSGWCDVNEFQCYSGQCILASWVCDGSYDCPNGEDEQHCDGFSRCTPLEFKCRNDGSCISMTQVCNGVYDCPDRTDEVNCEQYLPNEPATPSCSVGFFPCDGGSCYPLSVMCDGKVNCKDGYDESNCTRKSRVYQVLEMGFEAGSTNDTSLFLYWTIAPPPNNVTLEFMPSITQLGLDKWHNKSWSDQKEYLFEGLKPFTSYNMTVYVRVLKTDVVFPPAKYFVASTLEGKPTPPWNTTAVQKNGSHILIAWQPPVQPNGIIQSYRIIWAPIDSAVIVLKLNGNETSHLLSADFQHNQEYSFAVKASNGRYESESSEVATITFDAETNVNMIEDLRVVSSTNQSVSLVWTYRGDADGFRIMIHPERQYPAIPLYTTKNKNCTLTLAPGAFYKLEVYAFRKNIEGPHKFISAYTVGTPLPVIKSTQAIILKEIGTTVKLSWERPEKNSKISWVYGVYYGIDEEQLYKKAMLRTTNLSITIPNLGACETYMFLVGIIGPHGYGPLSDKILSVRTSENPRAPPKNVRVGSNPLDALNMTVTWEPTCSTMKNHSYLVTIRETTTKRRWNFGTEKNQYQYSANIEQGAVYSITVQTAIPNAIPSQPVIFSGPFIPPPTELMVQAESNGSLFLYWQEQTLPKESGPYKYEILVHEGSDMNETTAMKFLVERPPFIYTNDSALMYSFAIRIKTDKGIKSKLSAKVSRNIGAQASKQESSVSLLAIIVPSLLIVVAFLAIIGFLVVRNRRLHNSFVRFANSHYNSRSGAATFDDHSLEEEDSPQIIGFSDDEPLVVA